jgi:PhnB protein
MTVQPIPEGSQRVTPYLVVGGAAECLAFIRDVFGAEERFRMDIPGGKVGHAETAIGDSVVMVADAGGEHPPQPAMLHVYVEDCDTTFQRAIAAGATALREPADQFYGDRSAQVRDRFGNQWSLATHIEDVSEEEMAARAQQWSEDNA